MRPVTELYDRHRGSEIYVVGTGASMRVFPTGFLADKITIGLNMAWKVAPLTYGITIGPHLNVPEFLGEQPHPEITWITKRAKARAVLTPEQFEYADRHFYAYESHGKPNTQPTDEPNDEGRVLDWIRQPTGVKLYQWSSISQTAVNLAANMGATTIVLVGCDNRSLVGNHHAHEQHTKWLGADPDRRYGQYFEGLAEVRSALRVRGVDLVSMSPFLRVGDADDEYSALCDELGEPRLLSGDDISDVDHPSRLVGRAKRLRATDARGRTWFLTRRVRRVKRALASAPGVQRAGAPGEEPANHRESGQASG